MSNLSANGFNCDGAVCHVYVGQDKRQSTPDANAVIAPANHLSIALGKLHTTVSRCTCIIRLKDQA